RSTSPTRPRACWISSGSGTRGTKWSREAKRPRTVAVCRYRAGRILANPLEPCKGALLINPDGPGGPGIDFALGELQTSPFDAIAPSYDIIGADPARAAAVA